MKEFSGQAKNEKLLFYSREHILSYIFRYLSKIIIIFVSVLIYVFIMMFFEKLLIGIISGITILMLFDFYFAWLWLKTYVIITNKRVIKHVQTGIFNSHQKELKIDNMQEKISNKGGLIPKIFHYRDVSFVGKDEKSVIWFRGCPLGDEVAMYVSRLRDYCQENPDYNYNEIKEFISRKKRNKINL